MKLKELIDIRTKQYHVEFKIIFSGVYKQVQF